MNHVPANHNQLDCDAFERRIQEVMDARQSLADDERLARHAFQCGECDALLEDYQVLEDGLAANLKDISGEESVVDLSLSNLVIPDSIANPKKNQVTFWNSPAGRTFVSMATICAILLISTTFAMKAINSSKVTAPIAKVVPTESSVASVESTFAATTTAPPIGSMASALAFTRNAAPASPQTPPSTSIVPAFHTPQAPLLEWGVQNWNDVSQSLGSIRQYCKYSAELPGIRPLQCSLELTLDFIQGSLRWDWDPTRDPDLGIRFHQIEELNAFPTV